MTISHLLLFNGKMEEVILESRLRTLKTMGYGESHAKLILIGEHSVVYGQPAIALPLPDIKTKVQLSPQRGSAQIESRYYTGLLAQLPASMKGIQKLISALQVRFKDDGHWAMTVTSQIPAERGMGSSAAAAVAIVRAFFDYYEVPLDRQELLKWADIEEKVTHRSPSGLDAATVSSAQPLWFVRGQAGVTLPLDLDAYVVIGDSGVHGATKEAIAAVKAELTAHPTTAQAAIDDLGRLAKDAKHFLASNQPQALGTVLDKAQINLATLNVSDPTLDRLIAEAKRAGALGAKLTGGGRGGCFFTLAKDHQTANQLVTNLQNAGATQTWLQPLKEEV